MKKNLLIAALLMGSCFTASAQTTIFEDSFETYADFDKADVGEWSFVDVDLLPTYGFTGVSFTNSGTPMAFIVFNSTATTPPLTSTATSNWTARTGSKAMVSFAGEPTATQTANNDWLISPQISLGSDGNMLSFWAKSADAGFQESFNVLVSTTGTDMGDFTKISGATPLLAALATYGEHTFDLDNYAGQQIYIAIQNVSADKFGLAIDDFKVTATTLGLNETLASRFSVFPNPATNVVNIANAENALVTGVSIVDMNGRTVKSVSFDGVAEAQINVSDLASGMYLMNIASDKGTTTKKIVKN